MKIPHILIALLFLFSCKSRIEFVEQEKTYIPTNNNKKVHLNKMPNNPKTTFYFIRHTETNGNRATNPHLIKKGIKRAGLYRQFFTKKNIDTIFTTNLNRTYDTAAIIAQVKNIPIIFYDPYKMDYREFLKKHKNSHSLIVGHSDTTPNFVNGILDEPKYSQMVEENYSDIFVIAINNSNSIYDEVLVLEDEIQKMEDAKLSPKELKKVLKERRKAEKHKQ